MRISIITPTLNRCDLLRDAMASVTAQNIPSLEHIIVDGGSTDGTDVMVRDHARALLLQDRGLGLYDAINIGIERATGTVIGILNSDDLYAPGALEAAMMMFEDHPKAHMVCGVAELFDEHGTIARYGDPRDLGLDAHSALIGAAIPNARFFRADVFRQIGRFSLAFRTVADREFLSRAVMASLISVPLQQLVYRYRRHDHSLTFAGGATFEEGFIRELLRLATAVGENPACPRSLRSKARALEGRCRLRLAAVMLRRGDPAGMIPTVGTWAATYSVFAALQDRLASRDRS